MVFIGATEHTKKSEGFRLPEGWIRVGGIGVGAKGWRLRSKLDLKRVIVPRIRNV